MKTGEGKTLVSTLPAYLNALTGEGVHIVTVNDYLAKRDAEWMGVIHRFLGLDVGVILATMQPQERRPAYDADITYGTNNEFGFDYLRDNMAVFTEDLVQRGHAYAIVDEVDSILVDEARTPLIISGATEQGHRWYQQFARLAPRLQRDLHYEVDEGKHTVAINEAGIAKVEEVLQIENLYDAINTPLVHHLQNAVRAKELYKRDDEYIVRDGEVLIVDEFTGRVLEGRRYLRGPPPGHRGQGRGLDQGGEPDLRHHHPAELLPHVRQDLGDDGHGQDRGGRVQPHLQAGRCRGPDQQADDPPGPRGRHLQDRAGQVRGPGRRDRRAPRLGQPILVGTVSIEKSERVNRLLEKRGIKAEILNAKHHEREAHIIAQAGRLVAVTVATNMAGRGVDIMLGGNVEYLADESLRAKGMDPLETPPEEWNAARQAAIEEKTRQVADEHEQVVDRGGLAVLGTERHESRRIDNQLRAAPAARATRASRASTCPSRTT